MTETEWTLKKENLTLRIALAQSQAQVCQSEFDRCNAELKALGDKWEPEPPAELKAVKKA